jgi:hypothetical protein
VLLPYVNHNVAGEFYNLLLLVIFSDLIYPLIGIGYPRVATQLVSIACLNRQFVSRSIRASVS